MPTLHSSAYSAPPPCRCYLLCELLSSAVISIALLVTHLRFATAASAEPSLPAMCAAAPGLLLLWPFSVTCYVRYAV